MTEYQAKRLTQAALDREPDRKFTEKLRERKQDSLRKAAMSAKSPLRSPRRTGVMNKPVMDKGFQERYESPYAQQKLKPYEEIRKSQPLEQRSPIRPF
jgi:hypothetical protein